MSHAACMTQSHGTHHRMSMRSYKSGWSRIMTLSAELSPISLCRRQVDSRLLRRPSGLIMCKINVLRLAESHLQEHSKDQTLWEWKHSSRKTNRKRSHHLRALDNRVNVPFEFISISSLKQSVRVSRRSSAPHMEVAETYHPNPNFGTFFIRDTRIQALRCSLLL